MVLPGVEVACWVAVFSAESPSSSKGPLAFPGLVAMLPGTGLGLVGSSFSWEVWGVSSSVPQFPQLLLLLCRLEGDREKRSGSSSMLAREPKSLLNVVVLQFCSGLQKELWWLEAGEQQPLFSAVPAVSAAAQGYAGASCWGAAGLSPSAPSVSCFVVKQSLGWDACPAGPAGSPSAQSVGGGGLHVSSFVRSMTVMLLHGVASVLVSSQVRSMISCGDREVSAAVTPEEHLQRHHVVPAQPGEPWGHGDSLLSGRGQKHGANPPLFGPGAGGGCG